MPFTDASPWKFWGPFSSRPWPRTRCRGQGLKMLSRILETSDMSLRTPSLDIFIFFFKICGSVFTQLTEMCCLYVAGRVYWWIVEATPWVMFIEASSTSWATRTLPLCHSFPVGLQLIAMSICYEMFFHVWGLTLSSTVTGQLWRCTSSSRTVCVYVVCIVACDRSCDLAIAST